MMLLAAQRAVSAGDNPVSWATNAILQCWSRAPSAISHGAKGKPYICSCLASAISLDELKSSLHLQISSQVSFAIDDFDVPREPRTTRGPSSYLIFSRFISDYAVLEKLVGIPQN